MAQKMPEGIPVEPRGDKLDNAFRILKGMDNVDMQKLRARIYATVGRQRRRKRMISLAGKCAAVAVPLLLLGGAWIYYDSFMNGETGRTTRNTDGSGTIVASGSGIMLYGAAEEIHSPEYLGFNALLNVEAEEVQEKTAVAELFQVYSTLSVPNGNMYDLTLADGSRVWLNSASQLKFPSTFMGGERRVYLEGEAYFDVAHDPDKPFIVETIKQELKVLGTEFNISAYREDPAAVTTLVEGRVTLKSLGNNAEIVLEPGQQACLDSETAAFKTREVDTNDIILWKTGVFVFEGVTLDQAMRKISRWYGIEYSFENEEAKKLILRGSMPVQVDITAVLSLLEASGRVKFDVTDNKINIRQEK